MESLLVSHIEGDGSSVTTSKEIAEAMKYGSISYSLQDIIELLQPSLTGNEDRERYRSTHLIASLLELDEVVSDPSPTYLHIFTIFFCRRVQDFPSILPCLQALTTIITKFSDNLDPKFCDTLDIVQTITRSVHIPSYAQNIRQKAFQLLYTIFLRQLIALGTSPPDDDASVLILNQFTSQGKEILEGIVITIEGEKDPRCLSVVLRLLRLILLIHPLEDNHNVLNPFSDHLSALVIDPHPVRLTKATKKIHKHHHHYDSDADDDEDEEEEDEEEEDVNVMITLGERYFHFLSCYFPITFHDANTATNTSNDDVSTERLSNLLEDCLAASHWSLGAYSLPFFLHQLTEGESLVHRVHAVKALRKMVIVHEMERWLSNPHSTILQQPVKQPSSQRMDVEEDEDETICYLQQLALLTIDVTLQEASEEILGELLALAGEITYAIYYPKKTSSKVSDKVANQQVYWQFFHEPIVSKVFSLCDSLFLATQALSFSSSKELSVAIHQQIRQLWSVITRIIAASRHYSSVQVMLDRFTSSSLMQYSGLAAKDSSSQGSSGQGSIQERISKSIEASLLTATAAAKKKTEADSMTTTMTLLPSQRREQQAQQVADKSATSSASTLATISLALFLWEALLKAVCQALQPSAAESAETMSLIDRDSYLQQADPSYPLNYIQQATILQQMLAIILSATNTRQQSVEQQQEAANGNLVVVEEEIFAIFSLSMKIVQVILLQAPGCLLAHLAADQSQQELGLTIQLIADYLRTLTQLYCAGSHGMLTLLSRYSIAANILPSPMTTAAMKVNSSSNLAKGNAILHTSIVSLLVALLQDDQPARHTLYQTMIIEHVLPTLLPALTTPPMQLQGEGEEEEEEEDRLLLLGQLLMVASDTTLLAHLMDYYTATYLDKASYEKMQGDDKAEAAYLRLFAKVLTEETDKAKKVKKAAIFYEKKSSFLIKLVEQQQLRTKTVIKVANDVGVIIEEVMSTLTDGSLIQQQTLIADSLLPLITEQQGGGGGSMVLVLVRSILKMVSRESTIYTACAVAASATTSTASSSQLLSSLADRLLQMILPKPSSSNSIANDHTIVTCHCLAILVYKLPATSTLLLTSLLPSIHHYLLQTLSTTPATTASASSDVLFVLLETVTKALMLRAAIPHSLSASVTATTSITTWQQSYLELFFTTILSSSSSSSSSPSADLAMQASLQLKSLISSERSDLLFLFTAPYSFCWQQKLWSLIYPRLHTAILTEDDESMQQGRKLLVMLAMISLIAGLPNHLIMKVYQQEVITEILYILSYINTTTVAMSASTSATQQSATIVEKVECHLTMILYQLITSNNSNSGNNDDATGVEDTAAKKTGVKMFTEHLNILIPRLMEVSKAAKKARVRGMAIECLQAIIREIPYPRLHPYKAFITKGLLVTLDDKKRVIRQLASQVRNEWMMHMSTNN